MASIIKMTLGWLALAWGLSFVPGRTQADPRLLTDPGRARGAPRLLSDPDPASGHPRLLGVAQTCIASVYWEGFGRPLADGRRHRPDEILAAHRTLPLGSRVLVDIPETGRSLIVTIADRGPYVTGRCLDLSRGAARALHIDGLARVQIELVSRGTASDRDPAAVGGADLAVIATPLIGIQP